jgi:hypothetical protein
MNMNKEYRRELRQLNKVARKIGLDWRRFFATNQKAILKIQRDTARGRKATERELNRISRRQAILEGRLA